MEVSLLDSIGQILMTMYKEEERVSKNHQICLGVSWEDLHVTVLAYSVWSGVCPC